ncbi:MAG: hypothetical protein KAI97_09545 [Gemmatimonadetes bacterium]|nr:hypothetical protein [Gemmatimonadota bacterium]
MAAEDDLPDGGGGDRKIDQVPVLLRGAAGGDRQVVSMIADREEVASCRPVVAA